MKARAKASSPPWRKCTDFLDLLEFNADRHASAVALVFPGSGTETRITFERLYESILSAGAALLKAGLKKGDRVGLLLGQRPEFVFGFLGCLSVGLIPVPMQAPRKSSHLLPLADALASFGTSLVLVWDDDEFKGEEVFGPRNIRVLPWNQLAATLSPHSLARKRGAGLALAYIQCTSGSTSQPKGCCIPHRGIIYQVRRGGERFSLTHRDITLNWLPFYHDMGLGYFFSALGNGLTAFHYSPQDFIRDPLCWLSWADSTRATLTGLPGFAMSLIAKLLRANPTFAAGLDCSSLRWIIAAAEQIHLGPWQEFIEQIGKCGVSPNALVTGYGMSETTVGISFTTGKDAPFLTQIGKRPLPFPVANLGRPYEGSRIRIERPDGSLCAKHEPGEIVVKTPSAMLGYWPLKKGSKQKPVRTGDLGFSYQGRLYVLGRLKEEIIYAGKNYSPQIFEAAALAAGLTETLALGVPNPTLGTEDLFMVTEASDGQYPSGEEQSQAAVRAILENTEVPVREWIWVPKGWIPRTPNGKKMRVAARKKLQMLLEARLDGPDGH